jgi:RsiW-degrading membrane proteinase PrsW (M82 family)
MFLLLLQIPLLLQKKQGVHKPVFAVVFSAFSTVCTLVVVVGSLFYWFASGHFVIFVSYLFALFVYAWFQAGLYRGVWVTT